MVWDCSRTDKILQNWRMAPNFAHFRAINQSGLAIWRDKVSTSLAAATRIRYALRLARSKLESQLTLLIALSNLILETMGDWRRCFIKDGSSHNILFLLRFGRPPLTALFLLQLAHRLPWLSAYNYFSIKALICSVLCTASWHDRKNKDETVNLFPFCLSSMGDAEEIMFSASTLGTDTSSKPDESSNLVQASFLIFRGLSLFRSMFHANKAMHPCGRANALQLWGPGSIQSMCMTTLVTLCKLD